MARPVPLSLHPSFPVQPQAQGHWAVIQLAVSFTLHATLFACLLSSSLHCSANSTGVEMLCSSLLRVQNLEG